MLSQSFFLAVIEGQNDTQDVCFSDGIYPGYLLWPGNGLLLLVATPCSLFLVSLAPSFKISFALEILVDEPGLRFLYL